MSAEVCKKPGCGRPVRTRGWCNAHYTIEYRQGRLAVTPRLGRPQPPPPLPSFPPALLLKAAGPCASDPEAWFPEADDLEGIALAKAGCAACPALAQCRAWALAHQERWGVWGGLSEADRRSLTREVAA